MHSFVNSGKYRTDFGISKGIEIQGRKLLYEGNCEKETPVYREKNKVVEVQEGNLCDRSHDSKSSIPFETLNQDLHNLFQAHLLDTNTIPQYLWRQGTLYDPSNDEPLMPLFPSPSEDTYLVNFDKNLCEILAAKVEESHLNLYICFYRRGQRFTSNTFSGKQD